MTTPGRATSWPVRLATPDDAEAYAHCYVESLAETYAHIMPPAFAESRRERIAEEVASTREELVAMQADLAAGREPERTHWVALNRPDPSSGLEPVPGAGEVVGIVSSGDGVPEWERDHFDNPLPAVGFNLDHLYTRSATHGTGLGQALLDVALGATPQDPGRDAWLWILRQNPRAEAFYRRNGFVPDGVEVNCGRSWFGRPMFRMVRRVTTG